MNAYAMSIEPHTNYLGRSASDDFDISMRLSLVGIGAVLQERDEYITIRELVPGGPAARSGKLAVGDRIVGVGQGDSPITDVVGSRVDEAVKLIRGTKDTKVVLDILPADAGPDGKHKQVSLVRDKIKLEEQAASKSVIKLGEGLTARRIGVIKLPAFYEDFEGRRRGDKDFRSASRDVARLSTSCARTRSTASSSTCATTAAARCAKPSSSPASSSTRARWCSSAARRPDRRRERRARRRGLGRPDGSADQPRLRLGLRDLRRRTAGLRPRAHPRRASFGKGTVQTMIDLDEVAKNTKPRFGDLKMTVAQFFRINGGTTQLRGVVPDIGFPSVADSESFGEASYDNALPWVQIAAADYRIVGKLTDRVADLQRRHQARVGRTRTSSSCSRTSPSSSACAKPRRCRSTKPSAARKRKNRKPASRPAKASSSPASRTMACRPANAACRRPRRRESPQERQGRAPHRGRPHRRRRGRPIRRSHPDRHARPGRDHRQQGPEHALRHLCPG
jgi:carboxyl-terminal processing protease